MSFFFFFFLFSFSYFPIVYNQCTCFINQVLYTIFHSFITLFYSIFYSIFYSSSLYYLCRLEYLYSAALLHVLLMSFQLQTLFCT
ncbi:hypothetical protein BDF14DRAFT_1863765 [Spinellus fusiger]|nr:hypothetical protein BDF14DRAFT_1863765 [Spinellus fusiger]